MDPALIALRTRGWTQLSWWDGQDVGILNARYPELFERAPLRPIRETLRPLDKDEAKPGTMSSFTGLGHQPPHTDKAHEATPPRYIVLRCDNVGSQQCATMMWSLDWRMLERERPCLLTDPSWVIRRSAAQLFYGQVLSVDVTGCGRVRFDSLCMSLPGRPDATAIALRTLLTDAEETAFNWQRGDTLLIDNWRTLHARSNVDVGARSRKLSRWTSEI